MPSNFTSSSVCSTANFFLNLGALVPKIDLYCVVDEVQPLVVEEDEVATSVLVSDVVDFLDLDFLSFLSFLSPFFFFFFFANRFATSDMVVLLPVCFL